MKPLRQHRWLLGLIALVLLTSVLATVWWQFSQQSQQHINVPSTVTINDYTFTVTVAKTPQQQIDGLSGWTHLDKDEGMYFPLHGRRGSFWMKDMLFSIDIIWIKDDTVAGIEHRVPFPDVNDSDADLPSYSSPVDEPQAVLEIASGRAEELGIEVGDSVKLAEIH